MSGLHVLCVDDDPDVVDLTAVYLREELPGVTVTTATDASEALDVLDDSVDCIVSDHEMPGMTGLEFLKTVRERGHDLPFVLFTGKGSEDIASEAISAGVTDYLQKGGGEGFELLANRVENAVSQWRAERDLQRVREKMARLHETALRLREASEPGDVYEIGVESATGVLAFDTCGFYGVEADEFVPRSLYNMSPDHERLGVDEGLIGEAYRTGESSLVDDVRDSPVGAPVRAEFRSFITVPIGEHGVFQAVSTEPGFFDDRDLELAELLVSHVAGALDRIEYERDLEETNEQLEAVLSNTTAHVYIKDLDGRYTLVNEQFAERLGMDRAEIVGRTDREIQDPDVAEEIRSNDRRAIEEGEPIEVEESARWDGERRVYYSVKAPLIGDDGEPKGVCGVSSDITELKARERQLERKTEQLDEFASVVSHDLRNPLTVAQGALEELDGDAEALDHLETSLARMEEIIDDLLALARGGRRISETEPVEIGSVAERAWDTVDTAGATLTVDVDREVEADPSRFQQLFENLFRNAVEHAGPDVTVSVERTAEGFAVADDGPGLPAEVADALDGGATLTDGGAGFGLLIVSRIADAHGWDLTTPRSPGGTRFEFAL